MQSVWRRLVLEIDDEAVITQRNIASHICNVYTSDRNSRPSSSSSPIPVLWNVSRLSTANISATSSGSHESSNQQSNRISSKQLQSSDRTRLPITPSHTAQIRLKPRSDSIITAESGNGNAIQEGKKSRLERILQEWAATRSDCDR